MKLIGKIVMMTMTMMMTATMMTATMMTMVPKNYLQ